MNLFEIIFLIFLIIFNIIYLSGLIPYTISYKRNFSPFPHSWILSGLATMFMFEWFSIGFIVVNILAFFILT